MNSTITGNRLPQRAERLRGSWTLKFAERRVDDPRTTLRAARGIEKNLEVDFVEQVAQALSGEFHIDTLIQGIADIKAKARCSSPRASKRNKPIGKKQSANGY